MTAYNADFGISLHPDLAPGTPTSAAIRAAVQVPVDIRAQGVRLVLFTGAALLARDEPMRKSADTSFRRSLQGFKSLQSVLLDRNRSGLLQADAAFVIDFGVTAAPASMKAIANMLNCAERIRQSLDESGRPEHDDFDTFMRVGYTEMHPTGLILGDAMVEGAEVLRTRLADSAEVARRRASWARGRINAIARTIRMISLNARVEATRAGPAGRAFSVIAEEIRTLSEQTEVANTEMTESLEQIMVSFRSL